MCLLSLHFYGFEKNEHSLSKAPMRFPLSPLPSRGGAGASSRQPLACPFPGGGPEARQPPVITSQQQCVQLPSADRELFRQNP